MTSAQATTGYYSLLFLSSWNPALLLAPIPKNIREVLFGKHRKPLRPYHYAGSFQTLHRKKKYLPNLK